MDPRTYIATALVLLIFSSIPSAADEAYWITCERTEGVQAEPGNTSSPRLTIRDVLPNRAERLWSGFTLKGEFLDQEDFFVERIEIPDPRNPGEMREVDAFRTNPDRYIWKSTLTFDLARLFTSPAQLKSAYGAAYDHRSWFDREMDPLEDEATEGPLVEYFARARRSDRLARIASSISGFAAIAERPELRNGERLPSPDS